MLFREFSAPRFIALVKQDLRAVRRPTQRYAIVWGVLLLAWASLFHQEATAPTFGFRWILVIGACFYAADALPELRAPATRSRLLLTPCTVEERLLSRFAIIAVGYPFVVVGVYLAVSLLWSVGHWATMGSLATLFNPLSTFDLGAWAQLFVALAALFAAGIYFEKFVLLKSFVLYVLIFGSLSLVGLALGFNAPALFDRIAVAALFAVIFAPYFLYLARVRFSELEA